MARSSSPIRLAVDPNTPEALRSLVDQARQDVPDASSIARFGGRVDAAIAANVAVPTVDLPPSTLTSGLIGTKSFAVALGVVVGGLVAGSIWFGSRGNEPPALPGSNTTPSAATPAAAQSVSAPWASMQTASTGNPVAAINSTADDAATTRTGTAAGKTVRRLPTGRDPSDEAGLLLSARSALAGNPAMALRFTQEHARRFPNGYMGQEREVIAIEALRRLGQADAAQKRGAAFEQQYPGSAHRSKIEQTLQGK
jgi:hypothetical protein